MTVRIDSSLTIQNELSGLGPIFSSSDLVIPFVQEKTKQATGDGENYKSVNLAKFNSKLVDLKIPKLSEKQKVSLSNYSENERSPSNSNKHKYLRISPIAHYRARNPHTPLRVLKRNQFILLSDLKQYV